MWMLLEKRNLGFDFRFLVCDLSQVLFYVFYWKTSVSRRLFFFLIICTDWIATTIRNDYTVYQWNVWTLIHNYVFPKICFSVYDLKFYAKFHKKSRKFGETWIWFIVLSVSAPLLCSILGNYISSDIPQSLNAAKFPSFHPSWSF